MKKTLLGILSVLIMLASVNVVSAKVKATSPATAQAIKYYKAGNYVQSYLACEEIVKKDQSNALAQYYLAMSSVQLGRKDQAINAYDAVIALSSNGVLGSYAKKGKRCLQTPLLCHEPDENAVSETWEDKFIKGSYGSGFSKKARGVHEKEKIENIKREINRNEELSPDKFKGYKDYSSQAPSNDEIVAAIRTLQRAGLSDVISNRSEVSDMLGINDANQSYQMLNMLYGNNNGSNLSPQVIQSLLTTQMTTNF